MNQPITMTSEDIAEHTAFICPLCSHILYTTDAFAPAGYDAWQCGNCEQIVFTPRKDSDQ